MARQIQTPRPGSQLERELGIKGKIALQLDETVVPVVPIKPIPWRPFIGTASVGAGGAGNRSIVILQGGTDETVVHITQLWIWSGVGRLIRWMRPSVNPVGPIVTIWQTFYTDFRRPGEFVGAIAPLALYSKNDAALPAGALWAYDRTEGLVPIVRNVDIWLGGVPGSNVLDRTLIICPDANNEDLTVTVIGEAAPAPTELGLNIDSP